MCVRSIIVSVLSPGEISILGRLPIWDKLVCEDGLDGPDMSDVLKYKGRTAVLTVLGTRSGVLPLYIEVRRVAGNGV